MKHRAPTRLVQTFAELGKLIKAGRTADALELYERMPLRFRFVHVLMFFLRRLNTPSTRRTHGKADTF